MRTPSKLVIALPLVLLTPFVADPLLTAKSPALLHLLNIVPLLLVWLLCTGLTRRIITGTLLTLLIAGFMFAANYLKLEHLGQPLAFNDALLAPQMLTGWDLLSEYADTRILAAIIIFTLLICGVFYIEKKISLKIALPGFLAGLAGLIALSTVPDMPATYYHPSAFNAKPWETESAAASQGLLASLVTGSRAAQFTLPEIDRKAIEQFHRHHPLPDTPNSVQPDIVLWLAESFFDPAILQAAEPCQWLTRLCELQQHALTSDISVSTYGGNTTRTEFEVLTSVPFATLGNQDYPYLTIVRQPLDSIIWALKDSGYHSLAIHPHQKTFWQRHRALPRLGFDQFIGEREIKNHQREGFWISDQVLARTVKEQLNQAQAPTVIFAISMEGHGPWGKQPALREERLTPIAIPAGLDEKTGRNWQEYIYHADNALQQMEELKVFIEHRKRPTLVIFFGDHLPGLNGVFDRLPFDNEEPRHSQKTPVLALANYPLTTEWRPHAAHELGVWTLGLAGQLNHPGYRELEFAYQLREQQPENTDINAAIAAMKIRQLHSTR